MDIEDMDSKSIITTLGCSFCKVIKDDLEKIIDFIVLESNNHFNNYVGIKDKDLTGKIIQLKSKLDFSNVDLLDICNYVCISQTSKRLLVKNQETNNEYFVDIVYSNQETFFIVIRHCFDDLLQENKLYKTIIDSMKDFIWIMDLDLNIKFSSPSVIDLIGYNNYEIVGKPFGKILSEPNAKKYYELIQTSIRENNFNSKVFEIIQKHKDGHDVHMQYIIHFLKNDNTINSIIGVGRDISSIISAQKTIEKNSGDLKLLLDSTAEGIISLDNLGFIRLINKSALSVLGYENEKELIGKHIKAVMGIDNDEKNFLERFNSVFIDGFKGESEVDLFVKKDGNQFFADYFLHPQISEGKVIGAVMTFADSNEKIKIQNKLIESERSKSVLIQNLPGLAFRCLLDKDRTMEFVSQGCVDLTGYNPENFINNNYISFNSIIAPEYQEKITSKLDELIGKNEMFKEEYEIICANGSKKWVLEQGQIIYKNNCEVEAYEGLLIDISDQKRKQEEIEYLSFHDSLTGIKNRIYFEREKERLDNQEYLPLSILIGDINGLKLINDGFGHAAGDQIIIDAANILIDCCLPNEVLARTSGDEFTILMPNTNQIEAENRYNSIRNKIADFNKNILDERFKINIAFGFATKNNIETDFKSVKYVAEEYMYKRKLLDRNSSHSSIISSITRAMFEKSKMTESHAERMQEYSLMLGTALNLSQGELDKLVLVSRLHDLGKVGINDAILNKPGKLTEDEWVEMKKHPEIGYRIAMSSPELVSIANYILCHHERWDGKGYPQGLKGEDIPLIARIISVVDAYDAMTEDRPYRKAMSKEQALKEIRKNIGTQFDPKIASVFISLIENS